MRAASPCAPTAAATTARRVTSDSRWNFSIRVSSWTNSRAFSGRWSGCFASRRAMTSRVATGRSDFSSRGSFGSVWRIW